MMKPVRVILGLGSNVGEAADNLYTACTHIMNNNIVSEQTFIQSSVYISEALLPENAPDSWDMPFHNQVVAGDTSLCPEALLQSIKHIEMAMGRESVEHWAPRIIDIDVLDYDSQIIEVESLTIPHAQMHKRDFVLLPLKEIQPDWNHPLLHTPIDGLIDNIDNVTCHPVKTAHGCKDAVI